jgi:hypothetical protein
VKTLSNFHSPVISRGGMRRKKRIPLPREERESLVKLIVLSNKRHTVVPIILLIKGMVPKLSMIYQLNRIYMDGVPS